MSELERYIKENINQYPLSPIGYPNLKNYDPQDEIEIMSREDENLLDEVLTHHVDDIGKLQIDIAKAMYGDWQANIRLLGVLKRGFKSYFDYQMDDLGCEETLQKWQDEYADEYARSAAIDAQIEERMMEEL